MTGYLLFKHAVSRVFRNLDDALAISGLIWIATMVVMVVASSVEFAGSPVVVDPLADQPMPDISVTQILLIFGANLLVILSSIWIAIEWHRFILLGERPNSIIPPFRGALFGAYFGKSVILTAAFCALALAAGMVIVLVTALLGGAQFAPALMMMIMGAFGMYAFYRASPVLPAAALGESLTLKQAWSQTEPHKKAVVQATFLMVFGTIVLRIPALMAGSGPIGVVASLITGWVGLMVGVSLLSVIYEISSKGENRASR